VSLLTWEHFIVNPYVYRMNFVQLLRGLLQAFTLQKLRYMQSVVDSSGARTARALSNGSKSGHRAVFNIQHARADDQCKLVGQLDVGQSVISIAIDSSRRADVTKPRFVSRHSQGD
jgi:hypothetical protein